MMLIDKFYKIEKTVSVINNHYIEVGTWYILRFILNMIAPIYFKMAKQRTQRSCHEYTDLEVIVSLTTFPARIDKLYLVLETLFRQTVRPTRIILWLASEQFPDRNKVDAILRTYINMGLEIKYCDDLRAHKKYYYSMKENPSAIIITVDDDIFCPSDLVERLLDSYKRYPECISCRRAHYMKVEGGAPLPYSKWEMRAKGHKGPDLLLCPTGCAGCLYPPGSLSEHVFDKEVLKEKCFYADDIWLKCMAYLNGTKAVLSDLDNPECIDLIGENRTGLAKINVLNNMNDEQMTNVSKYYGITWKKEVNL